MKQALLDKAIAVAVDNDNRLRKASLLVPFGWEYWGFDTLVFATRLADGVSELRGMAFMDSDYVFWIWLHEQINFWEEHWGEANEGSGPLKKRPAAFRESPSTKANNNRKVG